MFSFKKLEDFIKKTENNLNMKMCTREFSDIASSENNAKYVILIHSIPEITINFYIKLLN